MRSKMNVMGIVLAALAPWATACGGGGAEASDGFISNDGSAGARGNGATADAASDAGAADVVSDTSAADVSADGAAADTTADSAATDTTGDGATTDAIPDASADATPDATPDATSDATSDAAESDATADTSSDATADITSDSTPDAVADTAGDATTDVVEPDVGPSATVNGNLTAVTISLGKCGGAACKTSLALEGAGLLLTLSSNAGDVSFMAKGILTTGAAAKLDNLVDALAGKPLPLTYGCPGCADGPVVTLVFGDGKTSSSHAYGGGEAPAALAGVDALIQTAIAGLKACLGDETVVIFKPCPMDLP